MSCSLSEKKPTPGRLEISSEKGCPEQLDPDRTVELVIDLAPPGAKDFMIAIFGTGDKAALLTLLGVYERKNSAALLSAA